MGGCSLSSGWYIFKRVAFDCIQLFKLQSQLMHLHLVYFPSSSSSSSSSFLFIFKGTSASTITSAIARGAIATDSNLADAPQVFWRSSAKKGSKPKLLNKTGLNLTHKRKGGGQSGLWSQRHVPFNTSPTRLKSKIVQRALSQEPTLDGGGSDSDQNRQDLMMYLYHVHKLGNMQPQHRATTYIPHIPPAFWLLSFMFTGAGRTAYMPHPYILDSIAMFPTASLFNADVHLTNMNDVI